MELNKLSEIDLILAEIEDTLHGYESKKIAIARKMISELLFKNSFIHDGFGNKWSKQCPQCGFNSMYVVRPGKVSCRSCESTHLKKNYI